MQQTVRTVRATYDPVVPGAFQAMVRDIEGHKGWMITGRSLSLSMADLGSGNALVSVAGPVEPVDILISYVADHH